MKIKIKWFATAGICLALSIVLLSALPAAALEMKAGTAKAVITPDDCKGRVLVYGEECEGVNHDIRARALVLNDGSKRMVIVTYDLNCLDVATPILRVRCRDELGIDPAYLVLMATHNHAAPIQIVPDNYEYGRWLADRIFKLIKEAIENEAGPAKLYFGVGSVDFIRSDPRYPAIYGLRGVPVDRDVQVLKVMVGEKVTAVLFNNPTHPMQVSFSRIGVGHPGYAMDEVEKRLVTALAMYADACGGDQMVKYPMFVKGSKSRVEAVGSKLADAVLEVLGRPMQDVTGPLSSKLEVISLPLAPPVPYEEALQLSKKIPADIGLVPYPHPDRHTNWIRSLINHYENDIPFPKRTTDRVCTDDAFLVRELDPPREFPCVYEETIVATIGPMVLVAMQGEVCASIGVRIKQKYEGQAPLMVFAYMGEHNLYIPTRELVRKNYYEAKVIQIQYASPVGWAEEVEDEMVEGVIRMIEEAVE